MTLLHGVLFFMAGGIVLMVLLNCVTGPSSGGFAESYHSAVKDAANLETIEAGSEEEKAALGRWKSLLADLTADDIGARVSDVYADQLYFNDTLKTIRSAPALAEHFSASAKSLDSGSVKYLAEMRDEDGDYYVRWEMTYSGKRLNGGKPIVTIGMSQLRFNQQGEVIFHQDFWDSTSGIFEHLPFVGGQIKFLRGKL